VLPSFTVDSPEAVDIAVRAANTLTSIAKRDCEAGVPSAPGCRRAKAARERDDADPRARRESAREMLEVIQTRIAIAEQLRDHYARQATGTNGASDARRRVLPLYPSG
jgi:hypothetical protein